MRHCSYDMPAAFASAVNEVLLQVGDGVFEVLSTSGDTHLGGDDFDKRIVDFMAEDFKRNEGIDLRKDRQVLPLLSLTLIPAAICLLAKPEQGELHLCPATCSCQWMGLLRHTEARPNTSKAHVFALSSWSAMMFIWCRVIQAYLITLCHCCRPCSA